MFCVYFEKKKYFFDFSLCLLLYHFVVVLFCMILAIRVSKKKPKNAKMNVKHSVIFQDKMLHMFWCINDIIA